MRSLQELVNEDDSGWPLVAEWLTQATNPVEVLPADLTRAGQVLTAVQVTTRSPMGAIVCTSGGLLFDHGWLRILGSGHTRLPRTLSLWNKRASPDGTRFPGALLVADDAVGGFFALNGGAFTSPPGRVHYFAPDTLDREDTGKGYADFLQWACAGDLNTFYGSCRGAGSGQEVRTLSGDRGISIYPFLWAEGPDVSKRSRASVPLEELWGVEMDMRAQRMQKRSRAIHD